MEIECVIDYRRIRGEFNSQMPLSWLIKEEFIDTVYKSYECENGLCRHCLVLALNEKDENAEPELLFSCLTPIFRIKNRSILTQRAFMNTEDAGDVIDAYKILRIKPCKHCYEAKTMIFSHAVSVLMGLDMDKSGKEYCDRITSYIIRSASGMSLCKCLMNDEIEKIIMTALKMRRNRIV